ncbi:MAG: ABC transporter ATP-binding protein, partial [Clostridia bacterium]
LRTFIGNDYLETKTKDACDQLANMTISCQRKNLLESCLSFISMWGVSIFVIISTFVGLLNATLSIGVFAAVVSAVWSIQSKITVIGNQFSQFAFLEKETRYYYEFMALPSRNIGTKDLPKDIEIKFENVCFTYPNTEKQILSNLNLTFKLNKNIAIVGENGSGKSTIIKLLARLYEPTCGKITVGGVLLQDLTDEAISELFGFVFQEIRHYSLSLRENVAIGDDKKEQDDNAIKTALSNAGGLDLISQCGDNLDTMIGYRNKEGQQFSGGQYQRLQISRAFLSEHKFIVLDEPVASLDAFAESQMYETFLRLFKDKGVIVISHRLASAKLADEIFMLKDGKLLTTGTHKTLMKKCALYSEMFTTQAKQYAIEKKNSAKKGVKNDKE